MYTTGLRYTDYGAGNSNGVITPIVSFDVAINAAHVSIRHDGTCVFKRTAEAGIAFDNWYDLPHRRIVDALQALEAAISAAIAHREGCDNG